MAGIVRAFFESNPLDWRVDAEILPSYVPPHPRKETRPAVVVKYRNSYLRYSAGPTQTYVWDSFPDDMINVGLAFVALVNAPMPPELWMREAFWNANKQD